MKNTKYVLAVVASAVMWGFMGFFRRSLGALGYSSGNVVFVRNLAAILFYGLLIFIKDRKMFAIRKKLYSVILGINGLSMLLFNWFYYQAMDHLSLSAAVILLYTSPIFVIILSHFVFKDAITKTKAVAILLAFGGCCFVSGIVGSDMNLSVAGVIYGLASGFGYAVDQIFRKISIENGYATLTVNFYASLVCAIGCGAIWGVKEPVGIMFSGVWPLFMTVITGIVTCALPYLLLTVGLQHMEAGKVAILGTVEPIVATLVGTFLYKEAFTIYSFIGIVLVLGAVAITNLNFAQKSAEKN